MIPMTQMDFVQMLTGELALAGQPFDRAAVLEFVNSAWPLVEDNPDPGFWSREFLAATLVHA